MKQLAPFFLFIVLCCSCRTEPFGRYVIDGDNPTGLPAAPLSTNNPGGVAESQPFSELNFAGSKVIVKLTGFDGEHPMSYTVSGNEIAVHLEHMNLVLNIRDDSTLVAQGIFKGVYHRVAGPKHPLYTVGMYVSIGIGCALIGIVIWRLLWIKVRKIPGRKEIV